MAQSKDSKVIAGWDFMTFRSDYKAVKRPQFVNKSTGECFTKLAFQRPNGSYCFVGWSQELGELTNEELKAQASSLRIVELEVDAETRAQRKAAGIQEETYKVCKGGDYEEWETVDI